VGRREPGKDGEKETDLLFHDRPAWMPLERDSKAMGDWGRERKGGRGGGREREREDERCRKKRSQVGYPWSTAV
jgi:hypothetical protein